MLIENRLKVSLWVAELLAEEAFREYIVEEDRETDGPANQFAKDMGELSIGHEFLDGNFSGEKALSIARLLKPLAYSDSFLEAVAESAAEKWLATANTVVAIYSHEFRGRWPRQSPLTFLGSFDYIPVSSRVPRKVRQSKPNDYRYLEYEGDGIRKFWSVELRGVRHVIRFGRIGLSGQEHVRQFTDSQMARVQFERAVKAKEKAGYRVLSGASTRRQASEKKH
jgi:predicted DNA-binding WGR domain protein